MEDLRTGYWRDVIGLSALGSGEERSDALMNTFTLAWMYTGDVEVKEKEEDLRDTNRSSIPINLQKIKKLLS